MIRRAYGRGEPVTLVVPGLGATAGEGRLPASGVTGTRVVLTLPGHGDAADPPASYWRYDRIAADIADAAHAVGATRAIGVSLGAAGLISLVAGSPGTFERVVLMLPAALAGARPERSVAVVRDLAAAVATGDRQRLVDLVRRDAPDGAGDYVRERADALTRLGPALTAVAEQRPVADAAILRRVDAPVLVIGAQDDPLHPVEVAEEVAAAFPHGSLVVLPGKTPLVSERARVRELITGFLDQ